jgi:hypothetical protein
MVVGVFRNDAGSQARHVARTQAYEHLTPAQNPPNLEPTSPTMCESSGTGEMLLISSVPPP